MTRFRRAMLFLLPAAATLLVLEIGLRVAVDRGSYFLTRILKPFAVESVNSRDANIIYDAERGWALNPYFRPREPSGERGTAVNNSLGMRGTREYRPTPPAGRIRAAAFGDSFTYGFEVSASAAWPAILERLNPRLEVMNFGVPGYGTDQAYLTYRLFREKHPEFQTDLVIIGFTVENIFRNVNIIRPAYSLTSGLPFTKPRFIRSGQDLRLVNYPPLRPEDLAEAMEQPERFKFLSYERYRLPPFVGSAFAFSYLYRLISQSAEHLRRSYFDESRTLRVVYRRDSEAYQLTLAILKAFAGEARSAGAQSLTLILPGAGDLRNAESGDKPWQILLDDLAAAGVPAADAADYFRKAIENGAGYQDLFINGNGHFTPAGAELAAEAAAAALADIIK